MKRAQHLDRLLRQPHWLQQGILLLTAIVLGWCLYRLYLVPIASHYRAEVLIYETTLADIRQLEQQIGQYQQPMPLANQSSLYRQLYFYRQFYRQLNPQLNQHFNQPLQQRRQRDGVALRHIEHSDIDRVAHGQGADDATIFPLDHAIDYTVAKLIADGPLALMSWERADRSAGERDGDQTYRIVLQGQYRDFILFLLALVSQQLAVEFAHLSIYQQNRQLFFLLLFTDQTER